MLIDYTMDWMDLILNWDYKAMKLYHWHCTTVGLLKNILIEESNQFKRFDSLFPQYIYAHKFVKLNYLLFVLPIQIDSGLRKSDVCYHCLKCNQNT